MRNKHIDLIKCIALLFVILVHGLIYTGFYQRTIVGVNDAFYIFLRTIYINCVPLFLITTGYLMNKHTINKKYYKNIIRIIVTYIIISIIQTIVVKYSDLSINLIIKDIFNFTGANYSWYVKMYIGLFLLIPYLNIISNNLDKKQFKGLIATLIIIGSLPAFSYFGINSFLPNWWNIYPLIYYFMGIYIKKYNKINIKKDYIILSIILIFNTLFLFIISYKEIFRNSLLSDYMSIFVIASSYFIFKLLLNIKYKPNKFVEILSKHSLTIYLMSYIFDLYVYKSLSIIDITIIRMFVSGIIILILSTITSLIIDKIIKILLDKTLHKIYDKYIIN